MRGQLVDGFLDVFNKIEEFEVRENEPLLPISWKKTTIDYVVYRKRKNLNKETPFAFIVCTSKSKQNNVGLRYARRIITTVINESAAWLGVVIDGKSINVFDTATNKWAKDISIAEVDKTVKEILTKEFNETNFKSGILSGIDRLNLTTKRDREIASVFKKLIGENSLTNTERTVSLDFGAQFELISEIIKITRVKPSAKLCRYSSINSLYRIIDSGRDSMCGLAGMNDKSEGFYLDYCLTPNSTFNISRKPQNVVDNYNKAFITSLCDIKKEDNLTMWRLYGGEDGDGVCLEYEADIENLRNTDAFILAPVQYGNRNNVIVKLFSFISKLPKVDGYQFILSDKCVWSYFVKPNGFEVEEEYRLLYIANDRESEEVKLINNKELGIVHPIIVFDRPDTYPLKLKRIILGPKCKESGVNRVQLKSWLNSKGMSIEVVESSINIYR